MAVKTNKGGFSLQGVDKVLKNLNKELSKIKQVERSRLYSVGLLVKNRSVSITPVKYGNLKGSAYVVMTTDAGRPAVEIGYTASYAPIVHEMPASYNYTKPGTGPKFLEKALKALLRTIVSYLSQKIV